MVYETSLRYIVRLRSKGSAGGVRHFVDSTTFLLFGLQSTTKIWPKSTSTTKVFKIDSIHWENEKFRLSTCCLGSNKYSLDQKIWNSYKWRPFKGKKLFISFGRNYWSTNLQLFDGLSLQSTTYSDQKTYLQSTRNLGK